ncbi:hypothetical protein A6U85_25420 [Agrobacterium sp. 13-626]|nr:hypothetical protein A6U85_25420 [Agrobacterium sp. 13-626]
MNLMDCLFDFLIEIASVFRIDDALCCYGKQRTFCRHYGTTPCDDFINSFEFASFVQESMTGGY